MEKFIDVSYHKGYMDFQKVKDAGYTGVVLKATDGFFMPDDMEGTTWTGHTDPTFPLYWDSLKGMFDWRGCYHFLRVDDEVAETNGRLTSKQQILHFHDTVVAEGLEWDDIIILDIEQAFSQLDYLDKREVARRIQDAIAKTEELFGRKPVIYTGAWWWEVYHLYFDTGFMYNYPFWLSHYWNIDSNNDIKSNGYTYYIKDNRAFPEAWLANQSDRLAYCRVPMLNATTPSINKDKIWMWQFTESGTVEGISTTVRKPVDVNYYMLESGIEDWDEARGEPPVTPPEPPEPPVDCKAMLEHIVEVLNGLIDEIKEWLS